MFNKLRRKRLSKKKQKAILDLLDKLNNRLNSFKEVETVEDAIIVSSLIEQTYVQIGLIRSQPLPTFKKGYIVPMNKGNV